MQEKLHDLVGFLNKDLQDGTIIESSSSIRLINILVHMYKKYMLMCIPNEIKAHILHFMIQDYANQAKLKGLHYHEYWYAMYMQRLHIMAFCCNNTDYYECLEILCNGQIRNVGTLHMRCKRHYTNFCKLLNIAQTTPEWTPSNLFIIGFFVTYYKMNRAHCISRYKKLGYLVGFAESLEPNIHLKLRLMEISKNTTIPMRVSLHLCKMAKDCHSDMEKQKISPFEHFDVIDVTYANCITPIWFVSCDKLLTFHL